MKPPFALIIVYRYLCTLLLIASLTSGCSLTPKNSEGYYTKHYYSCGPKALEKALDNFFAKHSTSFQDKISRESISKMIQDDGFALQEFLSIFNKEALQITWPSQIKIVLKKYNIEVKEIDDFKDLHLRSDVAIVLIHTNLTDYHWLCFPVDKNIDKYCGDKTIVDKIYVLRATNE